MVEDGEVENGPLMELLSSTNQWFSGSMLIFQSVSLLLEKFLQVIRGMRCSIPDSGVSGDFHLALVVV